MTIHFSPRELFDTKKSIRSKVNEAMLRDASALLDVRLDDITGPGSLPEQLSLALEYFNVRGRVSEFLASLAVINPALKVDADQILLPHAQADISQKSFGIIASGAKQASTTTSLERKVRETAQQVYMGLFLARAGAAEPRLCRIEYDDGTELGKAMGTGCLVGPDLVLTNWHVVEAFKKGDIAAHNVRCRFDYRRNEAGGLETGKTVSIDGTAKLPEKPYAPGDIVQGGREASATELDYSILRLSKAVGHDKIARSDVPRGWISAKTFAPTPPKNEPLYVLSHTDGEPATISMGRVLNYAAEGRRLRHDAYTLPGASGSPVFNADFLPIALHHASDPSSGQAQFNQAVPLRLIADDAGEILTNG